MDRRKFIQAAAAAPLTAATSGVSAGGAVGGMLGGGVFEQAFAEAVSGGAIGSANGEVASGARQLARKYLEMQAAAAFVKQYGLPRGTIAQIEQNAHDSALYHIDPDLESKKSFSASFKFLEQKKRNIERITQRVLANIDHDISLISQARALGAMISPSDFRVW